MTLTNGNGTTSAILPPGIYVPTVTFFKPTREQELDLETHAQHMTVLAEAGVAGVVLQGSTGEAVSLSRDERIAMVRTAKETFTKVGNNGKIIAGTGGAQSTLDNIRMCEDAASAGADFALVLPPSYYPAWMSDEVIESFYIELADASPIPIIIYSYPAVSSGINMSTDLTIRIGQHRNIAGIKHTDHDVGRIAREAKATFKTPFTILGGATDYLLGAVAVGGQGAITGMGNVAPRVCCKALELATKGDVAAAGEFAGEISRAEWALGKGGVVGTKVGKYAAVMANGYNAQAVGCRRPLPSVSSKVKADVDETCAEILKLEARLRDEGYTGAGLGAKRS